MSSRRLVVHIDSVVIDAPEGTDLRSLEAEVRSGIAQAFLAGELPPAFAASAPVLQTSHAGVPGIGAAIAGAQPPRSRP